MYNYNRNKMFGKRRQRAKHIASTVVTEIKKEMVKWNIGGKVLEICRE